MANFTQEIQNFKKTLNFKHKKVYLLGFIKYQPGIAFVRFIRNSFMKIEFLVNKNELNKFPFKLFVISSNSFVSFSIS